MICNVFAETDVHLIDDVRIDILNTDRMDGTLEKMFEIHIEPERIFNAGDLMASISIPRNIKEYISANVHSSARNTRKIRVVFQNFGGF